MACYVDTSVLVALCVDEPRSDAVDNWFSKSKAELVSSVWCVTEFASALGIKQRTKQISADEADSAWLRFERMCNHDLQLLPADDAIFHQAALMSRDAASGLRSRDALHLATALEADVNEVATLDVVFARNAKKLKIVAVKF